MKNLPTQWLGSPARIPKMLVRAYSEWSEAELGIELQYRTAAINAMDITKEEKTVLALKAAKEIGCTADITYYHDGPVIPSPFRHDTFDMSRNGQGMNAHSG